MFNLIDTPIDLKDYRFNESLKERICLLKDIVGKIEFFQMKNFLKELEKIEKLSKLWDNKNYRYFNVSNVLLNSEFNFSKLKDYVNSNVYFHGNVCDCKFSHQIDFHQDQIGVKINEGYLNCLNFDDIIYIDSHAIYDLNYALNTMGSTNKIPYHSMSLVNLITAEKDNVDVFESEFFNKIDKFSNYFKELIEGYIYYDTKKREFIFRKNTGEEYPMKNTASGIKQLGLI